MHSHRPWPLPTVTSIAPMMDAIAIDQKNSDGSIVLRKTSPQQLLGWSGALLAENNFS